MPGLPAQSCLESKVRTSPVGCSLRIINMPLENGVLMLARSYLVLSLVD